MAPGYRSNNQSRRANRSYVDHDVFEGLPIRNWRRDVINIAPPPIRNISNQKSKWDVELPWGMPKDSHLLPQHSQDLLRVARSGRLYLRRARGEEEEVDTEAAKSNKPEKKEDESKEKGYSVKTWKLVPRNQEGPEIEFLAKRRKGLIGTALKPTIVTGSTITKARVRRTDAAGNAYFEDVVLEEGQPLEGEVVSQTIVADSSADKPAIDGIVVQPTPPRRRPPPPKRRAKGPGRGRKRKAPRVSSGVSGELKGVKMDADNDGTGTQDNGAALEGENCEDSATVNIENENQDIEMGDDNIMPSDEEGSDDEDLSEGEVHDDHDDGDEDDNGAKDPQIARVSANENIDVVDTNTSKEHQTDAFLGPEPLLSMVRPTLGHEHGSAGSPLRNVVTFAATMEERSPDVISGGELQAEVEMEVQGDLSETDHEDVQEGPGEQKEDTNMPDGYYVRKEEGISVKNGEEEILSGREPDFTEDEMLLDGDMSGIGFGDLPADQEPYVEPYLGRKETTPVPAREEELNMTTQERDVAPQEKHLLVQDTMADMQELGPPEEVREEEDTFEDLLGSLEDHLNEHGPGPEGEEADEIANREDAHDHVPTPEQFQAPLSVRPASPLPAGLEMKESHVDTDVDIEREAK